jgi:hypothetical protein
MVSAVVARAAAALANTGGRYGSFFASTAQAMRASLFANATAATLRWVRDVSCANHALRPEDCFVTCCMTVFLSGSASIMVISRRSRV